jgi:hypothetical protein
MQPVIESLSSVCKNYLAMEKENKQLATELAKVCRKCFFRVYCLHFSVENLLAGISNCLCDNQGLVLKLLPTSHR